MCEKTLCKQYIATIRTWPQTGPESCDLEIITRIITSEMKVGDLFAWMRLFSGKIPTILLTENSE